jgi:transcriptional regulator with XRE-family HTH domain
VAGLDIDVRRELGLHVRELRQGKRLTLAQLAASAGISPSALSQIERGLIEPSLGTLWQLNDVLGSSLFDFFNRPHQERVQLCRSDERSLVQLDGYSYQTLVQASRRRLDLFILTLEPGEEPVRPPLAHYGEECGVVTAGRMEVHVGDEVHVLEEGDSIWFDSTLPHTFRAAGGTTCTSIWTNTLPERAGFPGGG